MKRPLEVSYEQDVPRYSGILVRRVTAADALGMGSLRVAGRVLDIKQKAWGEAAWFKTAHHVYGAEAAEKAKELLGSRAAQWAHIAGSSITPRGDTYYLADVWDPEYGAYDVAAGRFRHDVSGSPLRKIAKHTVFRDKIYANIGDVNVRPNFQSGSIGTAVVDGGLRQFDPEQVPTVYVPENNTRLIGTLNEAGMRVTGSQASPLHGDAELLRLEGTSVSALQASLHEREPWLGHARVSY